MRRLCTLLLAGAASVLALAGPASADASKIRVAQQYGLSNIPFIVMQDKKLVEKHAERLGAPVAVDWVILGGPGALNEALIAGDLDIGSQGVSAFLTLWDRTKGTRQEVRAISAYMEMPMALVTTNPKVKSVEDFTDQDKIALSTIKVSTQALMLQMAAEAKFGEGTYDKLDHLTVSMSPPDGMATLMSGGNTVTAHFSSQPYQFLELRDPSVRVITDSYDILGGPATNAVAITTKQFYDKNPKVVAAFSAGLDEAIKAINADKRAAAEIFKRVTNSQLSIDDIVSILNERGVEATMVPRKMVKTANFMHKIGRLKQNPQNVTEFFFEDEAAKGGD